MFFKCQMPCSWVRNFLCCLMLSLYNICFGQCRKSCVELFSYTYLRDVRGWKQRLTMKQKATLRLRVKIQMHLHKFKDTAIILIIHLTRPYFDILLRLSVDTVAWNFNIKNIWKSIKQRYVFHIRFVDLFFNFSIMSSKYDIQTNGELDIKVLNFCKSKHD